MPKGKKGRKPARFVYFILLVFASGVMINRAQKISTREDLAVATIRPADFVMTGQGAYDYMSKTVGPIIVNYANSDSEIPALRSRLLDFGLKVYTKEIGYKALPAFNPLGRNVVAKVDYDPDNNKLEIIAFVPAIIEAQQKMLNEGKSPKDREDALAVYFAHEMMHIEEEGLEAIKKRAGRNELEQKRADAINESIVMCKTILEIVRPLAVQGRRPLNNMLQMSEELKKVGDDCHHPDWAEAFLREMVR